MNISPIRLIPNLMVIALTLGLACASSGAIPQKAPAAPDAISSVASGNPETSPAKEVTPAGVSASAESIPEKMTIPVGVNVGERVPDFAMLLADGTTVTSQQLTLEGKPGFLMFFATW